MCSLSCICPLETHHLVSVTSSLRHWMVRDLAAGGGTLNSSVQLSEYSLLRAFSCLVNKKQLSQSHDYM